MKKLLTKFQPSTTLVLSGNQPAGAPLHQHYSKLSTAYNATRLMVDVVKESADVFPPLKSVVGGLTMLLKHYDQYITNKGDVQRLIDRANKLGESITRPLQNGDVQEIGRREVLVRKLQEVLSILNPLVEQGPIPGFFNNADQAGEIARIVEEIRDAITDYQTSLQQGLSEQIMSLKETVLLDRLPRASGAGFDSNDHPKNLQGTQIQVLSTIETWYRDNDHRQVYWLNGSAGTGKTTISYNVAGRLLGDGLLGASFYCSRDVPYRREARFIFPTLAFQLAYAYPNFRSHLARVLAANPDVGHESLFNQLNKLLIEPLCGTGLSTVVVIDALDECEETRPVSIILSLLSSELARIPRVKFIITSRPEPWIWSGFQMPGLWTRVNILQLQGGGTPDVSGNVNTPVQASSSWGAPYVVGLHQGTHVKVVGFAKEESGRLFYNAISNKWARILVNRHHSLIYHNSPYCKRPTSFTDFILSPFTKMDV
ncbi:hypothetical protein BDZ94DRAFT_505554 [Collybia nuda]|uniref:NACHT domain-containing protein n=1 Tax=Collybia nuda TaxID=64659 RepID=A0A9P6CKW6_9AGAR|nr:hypothetical protein BDZ94DRAFT_505554 [Collybia nuda]